MLQMVRNPGKEDEEVIDLVDTPTFVLVQFCDVALRRYDMRNPDIRNQVQETINALKVKIEKESYDLTPFNRYDLKDYVTRVDDTLKQFT